MFRPRVIPVLLLKGQGLVKSVKFRDHRYIGDPINAVKLFNDMKADELAFLDIMATREKRCISTDFVKRVGEEANMPFSAGGGIRTISQIREILNAGAEKVIINTYALENPEFIREASEEFGRSTITVSIDVRKNILGRYVTCIYSGTKTTDKNPSAFALMMEDMGAGEILVNSLEKDGEMSGYDLNLIRKISESVSIPVVALGGAGQYSDLARAVNEGYASAAAAGSIFVYHGPRKAVLVNYPDRYTLGNLFNTGN